MKNIVFVLIVVICAGISYSSVSSINTTVGFELSEMLTLKSAHAEDCEDDESEYTATGYFGDVDPPFGDIDPPQVLSSKNEIV